MNTNEHELAKEVIGAAYEVSNVLGCGFLEKVYERALTRELAARGFRTESQVGFSVNYKGFNVGDYVADIVVEHRIVVELNASSAFRVSTSRNASTISEPRGSSSPS